VMYEGMKRDEEDAYDNLVAFLFSNPRTHFDNSGNGVVHVE
jgi:hypothetical protein